MFWIGFGLGALIGAVIGFVGTAICVIAKASTLDD